MKAQALRKTLWLGNAFLASAAAAAVVVGASDAAAAPAAWIEQAQQAYAEDVARVERSHEVFLTAPARQHEHEPRPKSVGAWPFVGPPR
jgi:hypothetical protein